MARLADDWLEQRQTCIDVLCAYLRMPLPMDRTAGGASPEPAERQVRLTIQDTIAAHLSASAGVDSSWFNCKFDFSGAELFDLRVVDCRISQLTFQRVHFHHLFVSDVEAVHSINFIHCKFSGRNEIENARAGSQVIVRMSKIGAGSSLRFGTPVDPPVDGNQTRYWLDMIDVSGRLSVAINRTDEPQPVLRMTGIRVRRSGLVSVKNQDNPGSHGKAGTMRQKVSADQWELDEESSVEIEEELINSGIANFGDLISQYSGESIKVMQDPPVYWGR